MQLRTIIVDDEANSRSVLHKLLKLFCPNVDIIGEASNIDDAYKLILATRPAAIFLDIHMPGGNGFALLKRFTDFPFKVIFVTGFDKYALDAIKFNALDYLLKPIAVEDLVNAVDRLSKNILSKEINTQQIVNIIAHTDDLAAEKKLFIHHNDHVKFLSLNDIMFMKGERNYTLINTLEGCTYTSSKNLGEYESILGNYTNFFRISKGYIININHITEYSKNEHCVLTLHNNFHFEISRRKKQELLGRFK